MSLSHLSYSGINLSNGGVWGALMRERRRDEEAAAARKAEFQSLSRELEASKLSTPDLHDLLLMVAQRQLTIPEARELAQATVAGYPWYAR